MADMQPINDIYDSYHSNYRWEILVFLTYLSSIGFGLFSALKQPFLILLFPFLETGIVLLKNISTLWWMRVGWTKTIFSGIFKKRYEK